MTDKTRVVVLISGSGSNLQALIDGWKAGDLPIDLVGVISNRPGVLGMESIDSFKPDLVVLAGFMRILTAEFTNHYLGRMLNIHPSLLPKFQGLHTHQRALDAQEKYHGVTVHFVTAELDGGPAAIQASVPVLPGDDAGSLAKRVQRQEHVIYPLAVKWFAEGKLVMKDGKSWLNGELLAESGYQIYSEEA
jgi:phosphoribosylglycinamide formyltransferase-1